MMMMVVVVKLAVDSQRASELKKSGAGSPPLTRSCHRNVSILHYLPRVQARFSLRHQSLNRKRAAFRSI